MLNGVAWVFRYGLSNNMAWGVFHLMANISWLIIDTPLALYNSWVGYNMLNNLHLVNWLGIIMGWPIMLGFDFLRLSVSMPRVRCGFMNMLQQAVQLAIISSQSICWLNIQLA